MVLLGIDNIREIVAFPKTQTGVDPLFNAPDYIEDDQLKEIHLGLDTEAAAARSG